MRDKDFLMLWIRASFVQVIAPLTHQTITWINVDVLSIAPLFNKIIFKLLFVYHMSGA